MRTKEQAISESHEQYFLVKCPNCGEEIVASRSELKLNKFEPVEKEYEYWQGGFTNEFKKIGKEFVSSDPDKDTYSGFKCPKCGHEWEELAKSIYGKRCNQDGSNNIEFALNETESKRAREFMKKHDHSEELMKKKGSPFFSTLGQEFTYTFTPGGLGPCISIECNYCHKSEEITDIDSW